MRSRETWAPKFLSTLLSLRDLEILQRYALPYNCTCQGLQKCWPPSLKDWRERGTSGCVGDCSSTPGRSHWGECQAIRIQTHRCSSGIELFNIEHCQEQLKMRHLQVSQTNVENMELASNLIAVDRRQGVPNRWHCFIHIFIWIIELFQGQGCGVVQGQADPQDRPDHRICDPFPEWCEAVVAEDGRAGGEQGQDHAGADTQDEGETEVLDDSGCFEALCAGVC